MEYKVFNPDYLENITGGDPDIMKEIVSIFREQVPEFVQEMQTLLEQNSYFELGLLAHKAKSSVAIMGMDETARMLKTFELQAKKSERPEDYALYIAQFKEDTSLVLIEIDDYIGSSF